MTQLKFFAGVVEFPTYLPALEPSFNITRRVLSMEPVLSGLQPSAVPAPKQFDERVRNTIAIISVSYANPELDLATIASKLSISASRLRHLLKRDSGRSFLWHLHNTRTREAAALLAGTRLGIREVAKQVGYPTTGSLDRHFKVFFAVTPMRFRAQHKKGFAAACGMLMTITCAQVLVMSMLV